jgi:hypothetical protein
MATVVFIAWLLGVATGGMAGFLACLLWANYHIAKNSRAPSRPAGAGANATPRARP